MAPAIGGGKIDFGPPEKRKLERTGVACYRTRQISTPSPRQTELFSGGWVAAPWVWSDGVRKGAGDEKEGKGPRAGLLFIEHPSPADGPGRLILKVF